MKFLFMLPIILCCGVCLSATSSIAAVNETYTFNSAAAPQATDRLVRDGVSSTCAAPGPIPSLVGSAANYSYETRTLYNAGPARCVTVSVTVAAVCNDDGTNYFSINAYSPAVSPATRTGPTWLGDAGISPVPSVSFSFNAPANAPIVILVERTSPIGTAGLLNCRYTVQSAELIVSRVLDIDADGRADALTDGLLVIRYLFGLRGASLTSGVVSPTANRSTVAIEAYLQSLIQ